MIRHEKLLSCDKAMLLVVDLQEAFESHIQNFSAVVARSRVLIESAKLMSLPIVVSEQYPKGLGRTVEPIRESLGECRYYDKVSFSCCQDAAIAEAIQNTQRKQVIVVGIETHVCIAQTALDLLAVDCQPYVITDAVASRRDIDHQIALARLSRLSAIITTTEAAVMELPVSSRHEHFKLLSKLIK